MKKQVPAFIILTLLAAGIGIYLFIPQQLTVSKAVIVNGTLNSTARVVADSNHWMSWWPQKAAAGSNGYYFNDRRYTPGRGSFNLVGVTIGSLKSRITLLPLGKDSVMLEWRAVMQSGSWPWQRVTAYNSAGNLKEDMSELLSHLKAFVEKTENIYGIPITRTKVTDTLLIVTRHNFDSMPATEDVYKLITRLKDHAKKEGVPETGYPMLHVLQTGDSRFETMVALPVGRAPAEYGDVSIRRMVPGSILVTEIKGGPHTIRQSFRQLQNYVADHKIVSPAKPFESLITNRLNEPDTSKWITKIYYPVF